MHTKVIQRFSRAGPRGRGREWATLGVHLLSWLLSNNRLEKVPVVSVPHTSSNRLLLSNQDKGCTPSVAHSLPLPLGPALLNLSSIPTRTHNNLKIASTSLWSWNRTVEFKLSAKWEWHQWQCAVYSFTRLVWMLCQNTHISLVAPSPA